MAFGKFLETAEKIKDKAEQLKDAAGGSVNKLLEEFNDAIPTLKALGLSIKDVDFKMGVLPEVRATLTGSVEAVDPAKIQELIDGNHDKDLLTAVLRALQAASHMKAPLAAVGFRGVEVQLKLGLPPTASVRFVN